MASDPSCGFYSGGDVWFNFVLPAPGELRIDLENISGNAQYAVYSGTCGDFEQLDCAQLDGGTTLVLPDHIGQTLYLRTWAYNSEEGAEFEICLWDPPVPTNDLCANALHIAVSDTCDLSAFSSLYATTDTAGTAANPGCGFYAGGDVWFTVEVPYTGILHFNWDNTLGNAQFALYEGTCGNFTNIVECAQLTDHIDIQDPSLANETLYLRMFGYNSEEGAEFELCAFDTICSSFEVEIILQGNTLIPTGTYTGHLWMGCPGTVDPASTEITYTPTVSGDYRLIAVDPSSGCIDSSECVNVLVTGLNEPASPQIQVYPNPSSGVFQLDLGNATNTRVQVLDMQGRKVLAERNMTGRTELDLSDLSEGIYQLVIRTDLGTVSEKIILQQP